MKKDINSAKIFIGIIIINFIFPGFWQRHLLLVACIVAMFILYPDYKKAKKGSMNFEDKMNYANKYNLNIENVESFARQYNISQMLIIVFVFILYLIKTVVDIPFIVEAACLSVLLVINKLILNILRKNTAKNYK